MQTKIYKLVNNPPVPTCTEIEASKVVGNRREAADCVGAEIWGRNLKQERKLVVERARVEEREKPSE